MAKIIPNIPLTKFITQYVPTESVDNIVQVGSKVMRVKIITDRYTRGFAKEEVNGPRGAFTTSGKTIKKDDRTRRDDSENGKLIEQSRQGRSQVQSENNSYISEQYKPEESRLSGNNILTDYISIVDIDYKPELHNETRGYKELRLPFVPRELNYEPASRFVGIATMGRNNPFYQFTGSEDTLQFDIDWFSINETELDRQNVINSCRWVEALSKSNGYKEAPHRIKLIWGQDDLLWRDSIWVVASAPYRLTEFIKGYRDRNNGNIVRLGMMPQQAVQNITLKRVVGDNMLSSEIIGNLAKNSGYGK